MAKAALDGSARHRKLLLLVTNQMILREKSYCEATLQFALVASGSLMSGWCVSQRLKTLTTL